MSEKASYVGVKCDEGLSKEKHRGTSECYMLSYILGYCRLVWV
jgi:hypothetical protein